MDELVESVRRLQKAETDTLVMRLDLACLKAEINHIDVRGLENALEDAHEAYESELDVLYNILQLFTLARPRRGQADVDRRVGRHLRDVMNAKEWKEGAYKRWWRGKRRAESVRNQIRIAEEEFANLKAVEQLIREDCYGPIVQLARVWTTCMEGRLRVREC